MSQDRVEKIQTKLERITRRWWFFLLLALLQLIPGYAAKGYDPTQTGEFVATVLQESIAFDLVPIYPVFQIIPIILVVLIMILKNKVTRLVSIYAAINYVLFAFLQSIAVTEEYGFSIITSNLLMFLLVAAFWVWEAIVQKNDLAPQKQPLWKYWVLPLAFLAFWFPVNPDTLGPDFHPLLLLTSGSGLAFCMMTPVYLAMLTLYHPRTNAATLRVTSLVGAIIGAYNIALEFFVHRETLWWIGVLHIPLVTISIYGFVLSFLKAPKGGVPS